MLVDLKYQLKNWSVSFSKRTENDKQSTQNKKKMIFGFEATNDLSEIVKRVHSLGITCIDMSVCRLVLACTHSLALGGCMNRRHTDTKHTFLKTTNRKTNLQPVDANELLKSRFHSDVYPFCLIPFAFVTHCTELYTCTQPCVV